MADDVPSEVLSAMEVVVHWCMTQIGPGNLLGGEASAVRERYLMALIGAGDLLPVLGSVGRLRQLGRVENGSGGG
jgi:hypothetical protein